MLPASVRNTPSAPDTREAPAASNLERCLVSLIAAENIKEPILQQVAKMQLRKMVSVAAPQARAEGDFNTAGRIEAKFQKLGQPVR